MEMEGDGRVLDVIIIGAGISGIATAKCIRDAGFSAIVFERTGDVGGLWTFKENGYGVMRFTHINVSKHNYCFSDYPFPDDVPDFPHNEDMSAYVRSYVEHFGINKLIRFHKHVKELKRIGDLWEVTIQDVEEDSKGNMKFTEKCTRYRAKFVAVATGHHAKPIWPNFPGQDTFKGQLIHSVSYNDACTNGLTGKKVVVVGIGNSAVDVACHQASVGMSKGVLLSTRSGAWIVPNYIFGLPTDHYACRFFLSLPWQVATVIFEAILILLSGNQKKFGLAPKMHALQTQPTVSPTLIHHLQRKNVKIVCNIQGFDGNKVLFEDGTEYEPDSVICCTGYKIDLPFLSDDLKKVILDEKRNTIELFKNVFHPYIGSSLAFIGFVQPASGGVLSMSEMQARWFAELCRGSVSLPSVGDMLWSIREEQDVNASRYFQSSRHTIQRDPILYNDEIASFIGAKPELLKHPQIAWRLAFSSCGPAQWRLQGPGRWSHAERTIRQVSLPTFMNISGVLMITVALCLFMRVLMFIFNSLFH